DKAPDVKSFFDDQGREYKAQWNPATKAWEPVGGAKAPGNAITITNPDGSTMTIGGTGAPKGYRYNAKGELEPIPGGPVEAAEKARRESDVKKANVVLDASGRAEKIATDHPPWTTGVMGQALQNVGGTGARDLAALIDTIKANAGFAELNAMRQQSPTGGALGQVTERELAFLQATIGNLEQSQSNK